jgi:beta-phosphoglucomutase-like phosphatase (HAD superfamily)
MRTIEVPDFIRALIFDCDGTLVDSMPLHMRAWEYAITANGGRWDLGFFTLRKGIPEKDIVALYNVQFGTALDPAATVGIKHQFFRARAFQLKPIQRVIDIVMKYHGRLPMAIASGGIRENVDLQLEILHIKHCFQAILTADDALKPKPDPDIFIEAAKRLGIAPEHCQVFEDGDLGLEAARTAGMLPTDIR